MINDPDAGNYDFTSIRIIGSGGAIITPAMQSALQQLPNMDTFINVSSMGLRVSEFNFLNNYNSFQVYGLTETCPVTMESDFENPPNKIEGNYKVACLPLLCTLPSVTKIVGHFLGGYYNF